MNCEYCGNHIPPNVASCPGCGAKCKVEQQPENTAPNSAMSNFGSVDVYIIALQDKSYTINAIKEVRTITGWDMARAKCAVEGNFTPIAFSISQTEAAALQSRLSAAGLNTTVQPANPAWKALQASNPDSSTQSASQKKGCLIMFIPLISIIAWTAIKIGKEIVL